jgi:hypothetical protein
MTSLAAEISPMAQKVLLNGSQRIVIILNVRTVIGVRLRNLRHPLNNYAFCTLHSALPLCHCPPAVVSNIPPRFSNSPQCLPQISPEFPRPCSLKSDTHVTLKPKKPPIPRHFPRSTATSIFSRPPRASASSVISLRFRPSVPSVSSVVHSGPLRRLLIEHDRLCAPQTPDHQTQKTPSQSLT